MPVETLAGFFVASCILAISPGPDNLFVMQQSVMHGVRAGFWIILGLCTGLIVHTLLVALGVAALVSQSEILLEGLKWLGAIYLLFLAYKQWRSPSFNNAGGASSLPRDSAFYRRGIILNLTNAKVSLFFIAYLPQFVESDDPPAFIQVFTLGLLFAFATLLVFGLIATSASSLRRFIHEEGNLPRALNVVSALFLVILSAYLMLP